MANENEKDVYAFSKDKTKRNVPYPAKDLNYAISFVTKIYIELGGNDYHDKDDIALAQNLAYNSIKQTLGTCQLYGLLELKHGVGYKPTSLFISIYLPKSDEEKYLAILKSLKSPQMYSELLEKFQGHILPQTSGLINTLVRDYDLKPEIAKKAADVFVENLKEHRLLDNRNILNSFAEPKIVTNDEKPKDILEEIRLEQTKSTVKNQDKEKASVDDVPILDILIPLKSTNIKAHLLIPEDYKDEDLERILKFVEALK